MKLGQKNTFMASLPNYSFKHRYLVGKVILFAENMCHVAIIILKWAYWCSLCMKMTHMESMLFKCLLEPFFLPGFCCHLSRIRGPFCYVPYHRSHSVSVSARDALQTHSWSPNITSRTLPFSVRTIPVSVRVLRYPTISEIIITLSFGTSLVNRLRPTHISLLSISDYGYPRRKHHMLVSAHHAFYYFAIQYYICYSLLPHALVALATHTCFNRSYIKYWYLFCINQFQIST